MRGLHQMSMLVSATALLAACSPRSEQRTAPADGAPPVAAVEPVTQGPAVATATDPPAESGLAIKRGLVSVAGDRMTFRPCNETIELWLLDQSNGAWAQAFAQQIESDPTTLYIEAYGERTGVAEDIAEARAYAGTLLLEEVLYAAPQSQVRGCDEPAQNYIVAARGNEPFWAVEVADNGMVWRQPEEPKEIALGLPQTQDVEGTVRYHASGGGHELELMIDAQPCRDSMSGDFFAYSARAVLDGRQFSGCARVGG